MFRLSLFLFAAVLAIAAGFYLLRPSGTQAAFNPLQYDDNGNGVLERDEVSTGVQDYYAGRITRDDVLSLVIQHFAKEAPSLDEMVERARPSVVMVVTDLGEFVGQGSGFIFEVEGQSAYVLTNQHVVDWHRTVQVVVNDRDTYEGTVLGRDADRDLAVVKICCGSFTALEFADMQKVKVGDDLVAVGYPLNELMPRTVQPIYPLPYVSASVTKGVVSAFRYDSERDRRSIQYDAHVNPGSSGGPLLSMDGGVIGINTWQITNTDGIKFAVSATTVQEHLDALKAAPTSYAFGPIAGTLYHEPDDGLIEFQFAEGFWSRDMDVQARFSPAYSPFLLEPLDYDLSYGLVLRSNASADSSLYFIYGVLDDRPYWEVIRRQGSQGTILGSVWLNRNRVSPYGHNHLRAVLRGNQGSFYVNGARVATLNLAGVTHVGGVGVFTGYYVGHEYENDYTYYSGFQGTSLDRVPLSLPSEGQIELGDKVVETSVESPRP